ncbi:hypothetical protein ACT91Q_00140 [Brevibacillus thermoruber]|uniref:hypothetical protein n=1 Tax=Brevibacillus thermoruber TaxID=33942 RepID=UPI00404320A2
MNAEPITPTFFFAVSWRKAAAIRRELNKRSIPRMITSLPSGEVAFLFPDLPVHLYVRVRQIFGMHGVPLSIVEPTPIVQE